MEKVELKKKLLTKEIKERKIESWPVWTKEVSRFQHTYDETEECYIIEGLFAIEAEGKTYTIEAGNFVTFRKGLHCTWDIKSPVKKHYNFP